MESVFARVPDVGLLKLRGKSLFRDRPHLANLAAGPSIHDGLPVLAALLAETRRNVNRKMPVWAVGEP
jgi:hypothetical protein